MGFIIISSDFESNELVGSSKIKISGFYRSLQLELFAFDH